MSLKRNNKIETWFRGFDSKYGVYGEETPHLLWLTTDWIYAKEFGDSIMEYKIDMSKCHGSIEGLGYLFDFDISEGPSAEYATYLLNEFGVNSYCYYGGLTESSYCMCLWDETPIVSQRIVDNNELNESKNMNKKVIKINEGQLRSMIAESIKKALNEDVFYQTTLEKYLAKNKSDVHKLTFKPFTIGNINNCLDNEYLSELQEFSPNLNLGTI